MSRRGIEHRLARGRLRAVSRGVYAIPALTLKAEGRWMAAVLACGDGAVLSHGSAAALWGMGPERGKTEVSVPFALQNRPPDVRVHRRYALRATDVTTHRSIPVTSIVRTLLDQAAVAGARAIERTVNEADRLDLISPVTLRQAIDAYKGEPGVGRLREALDARTFRLTDSELERRFLRLVLDAGLPLPDTGERVNGFKVDFYWPDLGLVVETDGITCHRTPTQQARDRVRDQTHTAAGLTTLRFTHAQIRDEPRRVAAVLASTIRRRKLRQA
jgi:very-short-patch-repair endonuclease